jgi:hypothetical protein
MGHLLEWSDGNQSATQVQKHMSNAVHDGLDDALVARLSRPGGSSPQHCHATLMSLLDELPLMNVIAPLPHSSWTHIILPSSWISLMLRLGPRDFRLRLGADKTKVKTFWEEFYRSPGRLAWARQHPSLRGKGADELCTTVPLAVHEDCGPCTKKLSARCLSFSSVLGEGSEKLTNFLCASALKQPKGDDDHKAWEAMLADFEGLAAGKIDGKDIGLDEDATSWRFVLLFAKADEECRCNDWGLPHFSARDECCPECLANRSNRPFTDLQRDAAWRLTEDMPLESYIARPRLPLHPLLKSQAMTRWLCYPDLMHMMDCKGVSSIVYGSVLARLIRAPELGANIASRLKLINLKLAAWYERRPGSLRLPRIAHSNVFANGWADLHGPAIKAANTRKASGFFSELSAEYLGHGSDFDQHMASAAKLLHEFYSIIYAAPVFMTDRDLDRLRSICIEFGEHFMWCREFSRRDGLLWWEITPKVHKMQHVPKMAQMINPRFVQCYFPESLIGTTTKVWKRSMSGRYKNSAQRVVLSKRLLGVLLRICM